MNIERLILNIETACAKKGEKVTPACINAGLGRSFMIDLKKGRVPSVERVQQFAEYLGMTTSQLLGEKIPPVSELDTSGIEGTPEEIASMLRALAAASPETQEIISLLLKLNPENQARALEYIRFELAKQAGAEGER